MEVIKGGISICTAAPGTDPGGSNDSTHCTCNSSRSGSSGNTCYNYSTCGTKKTGCYIANFSN